MEFRAFFKHMPSSLPLYAYAEKKITACIEKYVRRPIEAHVTFSTENGLHKIACHVVAGSGFSMQVEGTDSISMYSCVDRLEDKLNRRLARHKEKIQSRKLRESDVPTIPWASSSEDTNASDAEANAEPIDAAYVINFEKARRALTRRASFAG